MPERRNFRYDIVGCGSVMRHIHLPALLHLGKTGELIPGTCFDRNTDAARELANELGAKQSADSSTIGNSDADLVYIATPVDSHFSLAQKCLENGKHVFLEKPFTCSAEEARALTEFARKNMKRIFAGHIRRFYPSMQLARNYIASGALGKIEKLEATEGSRWTWGTASDYIVRNKYGSIAFETGSHLLDSVLFLLSLDNPKENFSSSIVSAESKPAGGISSHEVRAKLLFESASAGNFPVEIRLSRVRSLPNFVKIYGSNGTLVVPNGYPAQVSLVKGKDVFTLSDSFANPVPADFNSCVLLEHHEILRSLREASTPGLIDGERFIHLSSVLESLLQPVLT